MKIIKKCLMCFWIVRNGFDFLPRSVFAIILTIRIRDIMEYTSQKIYILLLDRKYNLVNVIG